MRDSRAMSSATGQPDLLSLGSNKSRTLSTAEVEAATARTQHAAFKRMIAAEQNLSASYDHEASWDHEWTARTSQLAATDPRALLEELEGFGFAWRDVARMLGVSVPAVQKWRRGEGVTPKNHGNLASLVSACELVGAHLRHITDVATWFEVPVHRESLINNIDLWSHRLDYNVLQYAFEKISAEELLETWDAEWREGGRNKSRVAMMSDGSPAILTQE